ncbi:MAG: hypothetical protein LBR80_10290 [Deltaproteobacteria bacterium]|nr:hypothetical protein [Deltaproteobacteria bacterium]
MPIATSTAPIAETEADSKAQGMGRGPEIHGVKDFPRRGRYGPLAADRREARPSPACGAGQGP